MKAFRRWLAARLVTIFTAEHGERFLAVVNCRGALYIITDNRILRYDPESGQLTTETYTR